ncbi:hypothetical protein GCM10010404_84000 [Nonomuraea africana]
MGDEQQGCGPPRTLQKPIGFLSVLRMEGEIYISPRTSLTARIGRLAQSCSPALPPPVTAGPARESPDGVSEKWAADELLLE